MKTIDFLAQLKPSIQKILASPLDLMAEGDAVRLATTNLLYNANVKLGRSRHDSISDGYEINLINRSVMGVWPVCVEELYVLTLTLTLLYQTNPNYVDSREIAESLLRFEGLNAMDVAVIADKIEGIVGL